MFIEFCETSQMKQFLILIALIFLNFYVIAQTNCVGNLSISITPPPLAGGYAPGTTVDICITVNGYSQTGAEWFHGMGINFGPGWDTSSINPAPPPPCDGLGVWGWYTSCLSSGSGLLYGPGFYYDSPQGSITGTLDGNPGNNYGDDCQFGPWDFCLSIQTNPNNIDTIPLTGTIMITSDGTTGTWSGNGCGIYYTTFNALLGGDTCAASFFYMPPAVQNIPINFVNTSTGVNNTYTWNFGDGNTSNVEHPVHTYLTSGTFQVCLAITDATGCSDNLCANLNVVTNYWQGNYPFSIAGTIYYDTDTNGVHDVYEPGIQGYGLILQPQNINTLSQQGGVYNFPVNPGDYIISLASNPIWTLTSDSTLYHVHVDNTGSQGGFDFGFKPNQYFSQHELNFYEGSASCLSPTQQLIDVENTGTNFISGVIAYYKHDSVNVVSTIPLPDSTVQNIYYWHYSHISPFQHVQISLNVDKPNTIGYQFHSISYADIRDTSNIIIASEIDTTYEIVTCSFDPNEKTVSPVNSIMGQNYTLIGQLLTYDITFQNTGNAPAQNVTVVDTLPASLSLNSFNLVSSSHPVDVHYTQDGIVTFNFYNINLPDSTSNEPGSHGFVEFTIQTIPTIANNTLVENTASVYFDQNPPVQTSTASTILVNNFPIGLAENNLNDQEIFIYPNPVKTFVTILAPAANPANDNISVYDNTGKLILNQSLNQSTTLDFADYRKGLYTVKILMKQKVGVYKLALQ